MAAKTDYGRCMYDDYRPCHRPATGDDKLCGIHRNVKAKRAERNARWERQREYWRLQDAQLAFARAWQEAHPDESFGDPWRCPLCGLAVQERSGLDVDHVQIEAHTETHGSAWREYLNAGR
jgi:hypothetical protein